MASATTVFPSRAVALFLPVLLTSLGVRKIRATARRARDDLLRENRLARVQSLSDSRHILCDRLVNGTDCAWDGIWDEPVKD